MFDNKFRKDSQVVWGTNYRLTHRDLVQYRSPQPPNAWCLLYRLKTYFVFILVWVLLPFDGSLHDKNHWNVFLSLLISVRVSYSWRMLSIPLPSWTEALDPRSIVWCEYNKMSLVDFGPTFNFFLYNKEKLLSFGKFSKKTNDSVFQTHKSLVRIHEMRKSIPAYCYTDLISWICAVSVRRHCHWISIRITSVAVTSRATDCIVH